MNLSTRSRYGVRLLFELAAVYGKVNLSLKQISERQGISEKYLGQIVIPLKSAGLVRAERGSNGGYALTRAPQEISVGEVVAVLEGGLEVIDCMKEGQDCSRLVDCPSYYVWNELNRRIEDYLCGITLQDMVDNYQSTHRGWNYSI